MLDTGGEFAVKAGGADVRGILIAHAMGHKGIVGNRDKIFGGCTTDPAKREGVFAEWPHSLKPKIL